MAPDARRDLERKSSAATLSDMEVFIFPELMYSLVLANIMSPRIWRWRDDPWFEGVQRMKPYRRVARLKQYIMDHYGFNLDLDTWGLTTKDTELARFSPFIAPEAIANANALFGYEGDRYYFDIDIRRHFGLDKYEGNVIPYWKTETVEAMDAFRHKPGYAAGAGECVSLSTLYAAALFIVARIPLRDIYLMATPLHSQNFVDIDDGILTNNRRLVTRNMWFNGTALSGQARRAMENEQVTIVSHETGYIHAVYEEATIDPAAYRTFCAKLRAYLSAPLTDELLGNFLRQSPDLQRCFQMRWPRHGADHYIGLERVMAYELGSPCRIGDNTRDKLMAEIESEEFKREPLSGRIVFNDLEVFVRRERIDLDRPSDVHRLKGQFASDCLNAEVAIESLIRFCHVEPRLPDAAAKRPVRDEAPLVLDLKMDREQIIARLESIRRSNPTAECAFHAYRDLLRVEAEPFLKAAVERSPVSIRGVAGRPVDDVVAHLHGLPDESIYDGPGRLAQPDEVWNYGRGDGVEKALLLANILLSRSPEPVRIEIEETRVVLHAASARASFPTAKGLAGRSWDLRRPWA